GSRLGRELSDGISGSALRAPIHGTVAQMLAIPGTYLKQGDPILHIVDNASLWLDVQIPEVDVSHIKQVSGAWILLPGRDKPLRIETGGDKPNGKL
ncbi:MAG: HlyD family efflux transporter periplasmic adaptor subunit, partial [Anaerolineae bacterium]|nr:HlyD family efflux transporter periplasmic adaptor subunit [Anaerolineae bacterium]